MDDQLCAPRDLSEDETAKLRGLLKTQLIISSDDDDVDADDLLDYAVDMIESGENIGHVTDELKFMEMPVCDDEAAQKLGVCLTKFFNELDGGSSSSGGEEKSNKVEELVPVKTAPYFQAPPARSYRPSYPSPATSGPPLSRSASFSSSGSSSKSWISPKNTDPSNDSKSSSATRRQSEIIKDASLKQHLDAYERGASSSKNLQPELEQDKNESDASLKDLTAYNKSTSSHSDDSTPALSLKERMAAYQGGVSSRILSSTSEETSSSKKDISDDTPSDDTPSLSLKERMAAFQGGVSSSTVSTISEETSSSTKELTLKDRMAAYQPLKEKENTLRDRMAKYESERKLPQKAKSMSTIAPKKKQSDLQDRMAKFSHPSSSSVTVQKKKILPKVEVLPKVTIGAGLQDRMAKYKQTVSPGAALDTFAVVKKKKPAKKMTFTPRKPGGDLQQRMSKFQAKVVSPDASETNSKKQPPKFVLSEERGKGQMSKYQVKEVMSPDASAMNKKKPTELISAEERGGDMKRRMSKFQSIVVSPDASEMSSNQPRQNDLQKPMANSKEVTSLNVTEKKEPTEKTNSSKEPGGNDSQHQMLAVVDASSPEPFQKKTLEDEHSSSSPVPPKESGDDLQDRMETFVEVSSPGVIQKKKIEEEHGSSSPIPPKESGGELQDRLASFVEVSSPDAFPKKLEEEHSSSSPIHPKESGDDLQDRMETFVEVSSPGVIQKKKIEEEHGSSSPIPPKELGDDLQDRVATFVEVSSQEENAMKAELESLTSKTVKAVQSYVSSLSLVRSISTEVTKLESVAKKAEMDVKSMKGKMKKVMFAGGKKKAKKEYEKALEIAQVEQKRVKGAKSRLAAAELEANDAKCEMDECRKKYE